MRSNSVRMAVGNMEQLSAIRGLTLGPRGEGHQIILGLENVGKSVATVLSGHGINPMIMDRRI